MSKPTFNIRDKLYYLIDSEDSGDNYEDESDGDDGSSVDGDDGSGISSNLTIEASIALNAKPGDVSGDDGDVESLGLNILEVFKTVQGANLVIASGSVVKFQGDAIVNAANEGCLGGGGVDGAIEKAGGVSLYAARNGLPIQIKGTKIRCRTGTAEITSAPVNETFGSLEARHVIHAVGPVYKDEPPYDADDELLKNAYKNSLKKAAENKDDIKTIAFSLLSSSRYAGGRGKKDVIKMGIESINTNAKPNTTIYMVAYPDPLSNQYPNNQKYEELINLLKATEEAKFNIKSSKIKNLLEKYKDKDKKVKATDSVDIEKILKGE